MCWCSATAEARKLCQSSSGFIGCFFQIFAFMSFLTACLRMRKEVYIFLILFVFCFFLPWPTENVEEKRRSFALHSYSSNSRNSPWNSSDPFRLKTNVFVSPIEITLQKQMIYLDFKVSFYNFGFMLMFNFHREK